MNTEAWATPGNERAVLHHALLDEDALGGVRFDHAAVLVPEHLHVLGHKGSLALEGQAVPLKDHLPLGRSQLEGRQLQGSIWGGRRARVHTQVPHFSQSALNYERVEFWEDVTLLCLCVRLGWGGAAAVTRQLKRTKTRCDGRQADKT